MNRMTSEGFPVRVSTTVHDVRESSHLRMGRVCATTPGMTYSSTQRMIRNSCAAIESIFADLATDYAQCYAADWSPPAAFGSEWRRAIGFREARPWQTMPPDAQTTIQARLREVFRDLPASYADRYEMLLALRREFHLQLAAALEPAINAELDSRAKGTIEDARELATWANQQVKQLGLTATDNTGRPANLIANWSNGKHTAVSFRLHAWDEPTGKYYYTATEKNPLQLKLTGGVTRLESFSRSYRKRRDDGPAR